MDYLPKQNIGSSNVSAQFPFDKYPQLEALKNINPKFKDGRCFEAHQQVYEFLVLGTMPINVQKVTQQDLRQEHITGQDYAEYEGDARWEAIQQILDAAENGSVYAVGLEDHAYNLLKIDDKLYLLDASFGVYKQITCAEDFTYTPQDIPPDFPEDQDYVLDGINVLTDLDNFAIAAVGNIKPELISADISQNHAAAKQIQNNQDDSPPSLT